MKATRDGHTWEIREVEDDDGRAWALLFDWYAPDGVPCRVEDHSGRLVAEFDAGGSDPRLADYALLRAFLAGVRHGRGE